MIEVGLAYKVIEVKRSGGRGGKGLTSFRRPLCLKYLKFAGELLSPSFPLQLADTVTSMANSTSISHRCIHV